MSKTLEINKWDKWQSYRKDRGTPPWIKVHRNLLSNAEWAALSDSEKGHLVSMWILAADKKGMIPSNPVVIQKMCMLDTPPDIAKLVDLGFISPHGCQDDAKVTPGESQDDQPEAEAEAEAEKPSPPLLAGFDKFWEVYPKKKEKKKSKEIWKRKKLHKQSAMLVADILNRKENDNDWVEGFIPKPTTYLNGDRWEDEIEPVKRKKTGTNGEDHISETGEATCGQCVHIEGKCSYKARGQAACKDIERRK
jgi:hypothetical protein